MLHSRISILLLLICIMLTTACSSKTDQTTPTETICNKAPTIESTTIPTEPNEYQYVECFIELYNTDADSPIKEYTNLDIQGEDYRTEYRLNAFKNAIGWKCAIENGTVEIVNYGTWSNDSIRVYAYVDSHDIAIALVYDMIHVLDASVSDDDIAADLESENSILLGEGNQITGYINADYADGGVAGYNVMIDCSTVDFAK